jgi:hypothetical protein
VETRTHIALWRTSLLLVLLAAGVLVTAGVAKAEPFGARVIWAQGDRAYLVARDSVWVSVGSSVRFFDRKKEVASGVVAALQDTTLIVARITSGSLARVKHLDRVKVDADRPTKPARLALRIGYPSAARVQPFFECRRMVLEAKGYRADTLSERAFQLVRLQTSLHREPDTLLVRLFDDAADEEIALERGELDVAVFWPGEASVHIREVMHWAGEQPVRNRGVIGAQTKSSFAADFVLGRYSAQETNALDRLNNDLFRGDLTTVPHSAPDSLFCPALSFDVDSVPGRRAIERALDRLPKSNGKRVLLTFLDRPVPEQEESDPTRWLFYISCPVISHPEARPLLETIDLSAIVNLFDCVTPARKP